MDIPTCESSPGRIQARVHAKISACWLIDLFIRLSVADLMSAHEGDCVIYLHNGSPCEVTNPRTPWRSCGACSAPSTCLLAFSVPVRNAFIIDTAARWLASKYCDSMYFFRYKRKNWVFVTLGLNWGGVVGQFRVPRAFELREHARADIDETLVWPTYQLDTSPRSDWLERRGSEKQMASLSF